MIKTIVGVVAVIYAFCVMGLVVRKFGAASDPHSKSPFAEVMWVASIIGTVCGAAMFMNPSGQYWAAPIPFGHKALFWVLGLLGGVTTLRTIFGIRPLGRKILTIFLGVIIFSVLAGVLNQSVETPTGKPNGLPRETAR